MQTDIAHRTENNQVVISIVSICTNLAFDILSFFMVWIVVDFNLIGGDQICLLVWVGLPRLVLGGLTSFSWRRNWSIFRLRRFLLQYLLLLNLAFDWWISMADFLLDFHLFFFRLIFRIFFLIFWNFFLRYSIFNLCCFERLFFLLSWS